MRVLIQNPNPMIPAAHSGAGGYGDYNHEPEAIGPRKWTQVIYINLSRLGLSFCYKTMKFFRGTL
jgi:hypothetical protein